jgi:predicted Zn finger-like uncharacterized protein
MTSPSPDTEAVVHATCPFCHTRNMSLSNDALATGAWWRCPRCGQRWDARRLAAVAAYAASVAREKARHVSPSPGILDQKR